jgi:predicted RNA-binding Zn ribbon-like protein
MARRRLKPIQTSPLVGGALCLDFVNTTGARVSAQPRERLNAFADLLVFWRRVGVITEAQVVALARSANSQPGRARRALRDGLRLRELLYCVLSAAAAQLRPADADLTRFNTMFAQALAQRRLEWHRRSPRWEWAHEPTALDLGFAPILHSAAVLLESPELSMLRKCGECDWLFLDNTKNHSRRWCKKDCRDRVKARTYYRRKRKARDAKIRTSPAARRN